MKGLMKDEQSSKTKWKRSKREGKEEEEDRNPNHFIGSIYINNEKLN